MEIEITEIMVVVSFKSENWRKEDMKAKYYEDADLLSLRISNTSYKYARQTGDVIVHYSEKKEPVLIEIVNAAKFLKDTTKMLPKRVQEEISSINTPSIAHKIR